MITSVGCSWCHEIVQVRGPTWPRCPSCEHRADLARMFCDCRRCRRGQSARILPVDLADAVARLGPPPEAVMQQLRGWGLSEGEIRELEQDLVGGFLDPPAASGEEG